jgi:hypothetical protein
MWKLLVVLLCVSCGKYKSHENLDEGLRPNPNFNNSLVSLNPDVRNTDIVMDENLVGEIKAWRVIFEKSNQELLRNNIGNLIEKTCFIFDHHQKNKSCLYDESLELLNDSEREGVFTFKIESDEISELVMQANLKSVELLGAVKIQKKSSGVYIITSSAGNFLVTIHPFRMNKF